MNAHVAFMKSLADEGRVLFAGPLAGSESDRIRVLLIADAASEADVRHRLSDDPWETSWHLVTASVEPWTPFVGKARLPGTPRDEPEAERRRALHG